MYSNCELFPLCRRSRRPIRSSPSALVSDVALLSRGRNEQVTSGRNQAWRLAVDIPSCNKTVVPCSRVKRRRPSLEAKIEEANILEAEKSLEASINLHVEHGQASQDLQASPYVLCNSANVAVSSFSPLLCSSCLSLSTPLVSPCHESIFTPEPCKRTAFIRTSLTSVKETPGLKPSVPDLNLTSSFPQASGSARETHWHVRRWPSFCTTS